MNLLDALHKCPLIPILSGITPDEVLPISEVLIEAGFSCVEIPLSTPDAINSIGRLVESFSQNILVGAGLVTTLEELEIVLQIGARLIVMPHTDITIIRRAKEKGLSCLPGFSTPTEAFAAINAGADALKLFPISLPNQLATLKTVLPSDMPIIPVGDIELESMSRYREAGASGFGIGASLYKPGDSVSDVAQKAKVFYQAAGQLY